MLRPIRLIALLVSISATGAIANSGDSHVAAFQQWNSITAPPIARVKSTNSHVDVLDRRMLEVLPPQERAEQALRLAIDRCIDAADYVMRNAQDWRGKIESGNRLDALIASAMNSPCPEVRMAGFEVQLAVDRVAKTPQGVEHLIQRLHEDPGGVGPWMLWHLGAIGALGVDRERILAVLVATSHDDDDTLRRWAVVALTLFGGVGAIDPLLQTATGDRVQAIREIAFCGIAQSGTFQLADRQQAIPGLLRIAEDPRSDRQNIDWSYEALREITGIRDLPQQPIMLRERLRAAGLLTRR